MVEYEGVRCSVNASIGRGSDNERFTPAEIKKKVMVVGGGPAGMEAARVMALRGHNVTLYDKEAYLGGAMNMAAMVKGSIFQLPDFIKYFRAQMDKVGVTVQLGEEYTVALNDRIKPDAVVVAIGGAPVNPDIPGIDRKNVMTSAELRKQARLALRVSGPDILGKLTKMWLPVGKSVVIVGGSIQGCETAEFLLKRDRQVTIVEAGDKLGEGVPLLQWELLHPWLVKKGAKMYTGVKYREVTDEGLVVEDKGGNKQLLQGDTVLVALPLAPESGLYDALQGKAPEVYRIGDCSEPGLIIDAVAAGFELGRSI
jgi:2,4-dienoyl-CoA reductase (NADPH2)